MKTYTQTTQDAPKFINGLVGKKAIVKLDHKNYFRGDCLKWDGVEVEVSSDPVKYGDIYNVSVMGLTNGLTNLMLHELEIKN